MIHLFEADFFTKTKEVLGVRDTPEARCEGQWLPDAQPIRVALGATASIALSTLGASAFAAPAFSSDPVMAPSIVGDEAIPEDERWLHDNPAAWTAYRAGMDSANAGEFVDLGSFSSFLDDSED